MASSSSSSLALMSFTFEVSLTNGCSSRASKRRRSKENEWHEVSKISFFFYERVECYLFLSFKQNRTSEGQVGNFCLIIRDLYICNETCTYVDGRICKVSSACIQHRDQRERSRMFKTAQGKCEIIRFSLVLSLSFFFRVRERNKVDN